MAVQAKFKTAFNQRALSIVATIPSGGMKVNDVGTLNVATGAITARTTTAAVAVNDIIIANGPQVVGRGNYAANGSELGKIDDRRYPKYDGTLPAGTYLISYYIISDINDVELEVV